MLQTPVGGWVGGCERERERVYGLEFVHAGVYVHVVHDESCALIQ